jgi:hypothetical protein
LGEADDRSYWYQYKLSSEAYKLLLSQIQRFLMMIRVLPCFPCIVVDIHGIFRLTVHGFPPIELHISTCVFLPITFSPFSGLSGLIHEELLVAVLWSRSRKEPELLAGAGDGAGISSSGSGSAKVVNKNKNLY